MKLSLSPETERLIEEKISSGRYQSADEVVREGLKLLDERDNGRPPCSSEETEPEQAGPSVETAEKVTDLVELFDRIRRTVPDSEWEKLPRDLAANYEHYLYGSPKQS